MDGGHVDLGKRGGRECGNHQQGREEEEEPVADPDAGAYMELGTVDNVDTELQQAMLRTQAAYMAEQEGGTDAADAWDAGIEEHCIQDLR